MSHPDVPSDLHHELEPDADRENCSCGHAARIHHGRCLGHHVSGGLTGMVQQCGCRAYQPYSAWAAERGWALCQGGAANCHRIVFEGGPRCQECQQIADDAARDAWLETQP